MKPFNQVLKKLREEQLLTQRELAEAAGFSYETIRSFEYGRRKPRSIVQIRHLIVGLDLDPLSPEADELASACIFRDTGHIPDAKILHRIGSGQLN
jgi:transcriptional regulator with XRE-family HTH domain